MIKLRFFALNFLHKDNNWNYIDTELIEFIIIVLLGWFPKKKSCDFKIGWRRKDVRSLKQKNKNNNNIYHV